jgi:hypothetical protein
MNLCSKTIKYFGIYGMIISMFGFISCARRLPIVNNTNNYHQSPYGAYIEIRVEGIQEKLYFRGELIAVDDKKVVIRTIGNNESVRPFALKDIIYYKLYYANNEKENYRPGNILLSTSLLSHGFFTFLTVPINALVIASVDSNKINEFSYTKKDLPISKMSQFARYPQGLPPHINLSNLNDVMPKKEITEK